MVILVKAVLIFLGLPRWAIVEGKSLLTQESGEHAPVKGAGKNGGKVLGHADF